MAFEQFESPGHPTGDAHAAATWSDISACGRRVFFPLVGQVWPTFRKDWPAGVPLCPECGRKQYG